MIKTMVCASPWNTVFQRVNIVLIGIILRNPVAVKSNSQTRIGKSKKKPGRRRRL